MNKVSGLTLNEILDELENDLSPDFQQATFFDISMIPGDSANNELTDEDSGDEENIDLVNLPPVLLTGTAVIRTNLPESDSDIEIPLVELKKSSKQKNKYSRKWEKIDLPSYQNVEDNIDQKEIPSPMELFETFIDEEFIALIVKFSNIYATRKNKVGNITPSEIKVVLGILLLSGYTTVSRRRMYWEISQDGRNELVSKAMSRDRFDFIFSNIHFVDNNVLDKKDKFAKLRPLIKLLNKKFLEHTPKIRQHSVDEQMVPYYGKHNCKQYIHAKPIRYGYKFWVGATHKGYIVWFEPYQGAGTFADAKYKEAGLGASVVLTYIDQLTIINMKEVYLYFDNLFTSLPLLEELKVRGFKATGTIRENRLVNCPLPKKKVVSKEQRGWYDYESTNGILVCCYNDNNVVNIASSIHGVEPTHTTSRWSGKQKKYLTLKQPDIIHNYNQFMGGVDRADQNISLYRVSIRGKKWYYPIFSHCLDLAEQNAWQLHKNLGGKLDHLAFRRIIATNLLTKYGKEPIKRGNTSFLSTNVRYDRIDHLLDEIPRNEGKIKQLTCKECHMKCSTMCIKCKVPLHVRKCNVLYHTNGKNN